MTRSRTFSACDIVHGSVRVEVDVVMLVEVVEVVEVEEMVVVVEMVLVHLWWWVLRCKHGPWHLTLANMNLSLALSP